MALGRRAARAEGTRTMAKIANQKTTKAEDVKSAKAKRGPGMGQLLTQPNARSAREEAKRVLEEALAAGVDGREEQVAMDFVKAAVSHVRPTASYTPSARPVTAAQLPQEPRGELAKVESWNVRTGPGFATEKQAKWMIDIASRPSVTPEMRDSLKIRLEQGFSRTAASAFITKYKDIPTAPKVEAVAPGASTEEVTRFHSGTPQVEAGRYAVEEDGTLKFFRVTKGKGRWEGRTFLEIQASEDRYSVRNPARRNAILATIAKNPLEAEQRYGQELGQCSRCGRVLTDATSREYGIGPDCRNKR